MKTITYKQISSAAENLVTACSRVTPSCIRAMTAALEKEGNQTNIVRLSLEDRKTGVMPNTTFIFSLNEIYTIQSLDVVTHQRKLAERYAAEEDREGLVESPVATEPTKKEAKDGKEV